MKHEYLLDFSLEMLLSVPLFAEPVRRYVPRLPEGEGLRLRDALPLATDREGLLSALEEAGERFHREMVREIREFGVEADPRDLRYQWGSPEVNEAVVSLIEGREAPIREGRIVFYGPSNIALWYSLERDMLPYEAYNHGIGGCVDEDMMRYAPRLLYAYKPSAVFFQTGSNDIASGIPLETILENKRKMYGMFLERMPQAKLVVCSGLPLPGRTRYWDATVRTNALLEEMCRETDRMYFLDATDAMLTDRGEESLKTSDGRYFNPDYFRMDRIHLNKRGHDVWTGLMKGVLESWEKA